MLVEATVSLVSGCRKTTGSFDCDIDSPTTCPVLFPLRASTSFIRKSGCAPTHNAYILGKGFGTITEVEGTIQIVRCCICLASLNLVSAVKTSSVEFVPSYYAEEQNISSGSLCLYLSYFHWNIIEY